jgi:uncharacterized protein YkwD
VGESRLLVLAVIACCAPPAARKPWIDPAPVVELLAPRIVMTVGQPAINYGDAPLSVAARLVDADRLFAKLKQSRPGLQRDARLDAVAGDLSVLARSDAEISHGAAEFSLHARGVIEPAARIVVVDNGFDDGSLKSELAPENVRIGIGGSPLVIVIVHSMLASLAPVPRRVELQQSARLRGNVDERFHGWRLTVAADGRRPERIVDDSSPGEGFDVRLACNDVPGTRWVSLEALDADNQLTQLALFPIGCGAALPTSYYVEPRGNLRAGDAEHRIMALLNRERVAGGLQPLRPEPRLVRASHSYAELMKGARSVAHDLGRTTPTGRLRNVDLVAPVTTECTLQASSLGAAAEVLWNDPAYRVAFEKREATHVGVGIAEDAQHELYIDIDLVRVVPPADLRKVRQRLQARIGASSERAVHVDTTLERFADRAAQQLATGSDPEELSRHLMREMMQSLPKDTVFDSTEVILRDVDEWNDELLQTSLPFDTFAVGVAQTARDGRDAGQLWVVGFFTAHVDSHH